MKYAIAFVFALTFLVGFAQNKIEGSYNTPVYLLDTLLYEHIIFVPANVEYTLKGALPIWDKIDGVGFTLHPVINAKVISVRHYGNGEVDTTCCGTLMSKTNYYGNLITSTSQQINGEWVSSPVRYNTDPNEWDHQQHIRSVKANFPSWVTYYTIEKVKQ